MAFLRLHSLTIFAEVSIRSVQDVIVFELVWSQYNLLLRLLLLVLAVVMEFDGSALFAERPRVYVPPVNFALTAGRLARFVLRTPSPTLRRLRSLEVLGLPILTIFEDLRTHRAHILLKEDARHRVVFSRHIFLEQGVDISQVVLAQSSALVVLACGELRGKVGLRSVVVGRNDCLDVRLGVERHIEDCCLQD